MPKVPHRRRVRKKSKPYDKDIKAGTLARRKARLERTIERCRQELEQRSDSESGDDSEPGENCLTEQEKRFAVKYFWKACGKPTEPEEWQGHNGTITVIRRRIGPTAPTRKAVLRTLQRLVEDEDDDLRHRSTGKASTLDEEMDLYVGLLICEGHSQRSAMLLINGERCVNGLPPISRTAVRFAEQRVELLRRKRRSTKSGY